MAVSIQSNNFSAQTANVSLYAATGNTIPFSAATLINVGTKTIPFTYSSTTISNEYGTFSCQFTSFSNKICTTSKLTPPDGDGNQYRTIQIGNQIWMSESLRATKFRDGTPLDNTSQVNNTTWSNSSISSNKYWAFVYGNSGNTETNGLLYNRFAITGSTQGASASSSLCPAGWHIPTVAEANTFIANIGSNIAARYPGSTYWYSIGAFFDGTNISGFSSLGSDNRGADGNYTQFTGLTNSIWITPSSSLVISFSGDLASIPFIDAVDDARIGLSVRCIKD